MADRPMGKASAAAPPVALDLAGQIGELRGRLEEHTEQDAEHFRSLHSAVGDVREDCRATRETVAVIADRLDVENVAELPRRRLGKRAVQGTAALGGGAAVVYVLERLPQIIEAIKQLGS